MNLQVKAVYRNGAFEVLEPVSLPQDSEVNLIIEGPLVISPEITNPEERSRVLLAVTERMRRNPLPADAPRLSRDNLHERR